MLPSLCEEHSYLVWQRHIATLATIGWLAVQSSCPARLPRGGKCVDCGGSFSKRRSPPSVAPLKGRPVTPLRKAKSNIARPLATRAEVCVEINVPKPITEDDRFGIFSITKLRSVEAGDDLTISVSSESSLPSDFGPDVHVAKVSDNVLTAELVIDVDQTKTLEDVELFLATQEPPREKRKGVPKVVRFGRVDTRDFEKYIDEDAGCSPFIHDDYDFVLESLEKNESISKLVEYIPPTALECVSFKEAAEKVGNKLTQPFGALRDAVWGAMVSSSDHLEGKLSSDSTVASELGSDDDAASLSSLERASSVDDNCTMSAFSALEHKLSLLGPTTTF